MSRPDDIPQDVWVGAQDIAHDVYEANCQLMEDGESPVNTALVIARAILAERERCAKVAEGFERNRDWVPGSLYDTLRREVAAAIRQGSI